jgi:hypothetical protein
MMSPASFRFAALIACVSSEILADAKPWQQLEPQWFNQIIYQPNCSAGDCICDCLSDRSCLPACSR